MNTICTCIAYNFIEKLSETEFQTFQAMFLSFLTNLIFFVALKNDDLLGLNVQCIILEKYFFEERQKVWGFEANAL